MGSTSRPVTRCPCPARIAPGVATRGDSVFPRKTGIGATVICWRRESSCWFSGAAKTSVGVPEYHEPLLKARARGPREFVGPTHHPRTGDRPSRLVLRIGPMDGGPCAAAHCMTMIIRLIHVMCALSLGGLQHALLPSLPGLFPRSFPSFVGLAQPHSASVDASASRSIRP